MKHEHSQHWGTGGSWLLVLKIPCDDACTQKSNSHIIGKLYCLIAMKKKKKTGDMTSNWKGFCRKAELTPSLYGAKWIKTLLHSLCADVIASSISKSLWRLVVWVANACNVIPLTLTFISISSQILHPVSYKCSNHLINSKCSPIPKKFKQSLFSPLYSLCVQKFHTPSEQQCASLSGYPPS